MSDVHGIGRSTRRVVDSQRRRLAALRRGWTFRGKRDAPLGRLHPANSFVTREIVAKTALGSGLDEQPRWG